MENEMLIYRSADGNIKIDVRMGEETVWLTQDQMATLFGKAKSTINEHLKNIFSEGELVADSVIRNFRTTAADGKSYDTNYYNLDVIISVGYRVKSHQGTQFRIWATQVLREYLIKGFALNDERMKSGKSMNYFDELQERIREIRLSERVFYQKVKDIYIRAIRDTFGDVPYCVINDGDVSALAGAMSLNDSSVLGIAMGTSEAVGYVDPQGRITGWLNELAFVPVDAQADAMRAAASNTATGPMMAFANMNMANAAGGMDASSLFAMGAAQNQTAQNQAAGSQAANPAAGRGGSGAPVPGWTCKCGHGDNRGKFCMECGSPKPTEAGWTCSCGAVNQGKFCTDCGAKKPEGAPLYRCDKCGWEPEDPAHPPKFCPECGDVFNENDRL